MANKTYRDVTVKIDNTVGTITAITNWINSESLAAAQSLIHDNAFGTNYQNSYKGVMSASLSLAGFVNSTMSPIIQKMQVTTTSVTKTIEIYDGLKYINGEFLWSNVTVSGRQEDMQVWSADFASHGGLNRTSVALA